MILSLPDYGLKWLFSKCACHFQCIFKFQLIDNVLFSLIPNDASLIWIVIIFNTLVKYQMLLMNASDSHDINSDSSYIFCLVTLGKVLLICDGVLDQNRRVEFVNIQWLLLYFSILFRAVTLLENDPPKVEASGFLIQFKGTSKKIEKMTYLDPQMAKFCFLLL